MQETHNYNHQQRYHHSAAVNGGGSGGGGGVGVGALPTSLKLPNKPRQVPMFVPPGHVAFRILCHVSRVGGLIGKSGSIIRQMAVETSSKIRVEDLPNSAGSNSDVHRVILIVGPTSLNKRIKLHATKTTTPQEGSKNQSFNDGWGENGDNDDVDGGDDGSVEVSAAQEAAVRVFERVIEVAAESNGVTAAVAVEGLVSCRLLMDRGQVGTVIGKGGRNIEMIKKNTLCRIKVLNNEKLPACAFPNDVMVELEGDIIAVKKALIAVCRCIQDYLPMNQPRINGGRAFELVQHEALADPHMDQPMHRGSLSQPMPTSSSNYHHSGGRGQSSFPEGERVPTVEPRTSLKEIVFNILCPNDKAGSVIGKGGSIIKALQIESNACITIGPNIGDCIERLITISSMENPESRYSPAQSAVILVFNRFMAGGVERDQDFGSRGPPVSARLVVQANDVGCLLGKGGAIISEMRKVTGAGLRILGGDQLPECVTGNVEVVQITGTFMNVQNALYNVTSRLRDNLLQFKMSNAGGSRNGVSSSHENSPYGGVRGPPPSGLHPSAGVARDIDQHSAMVQKMDRLKLGQNMDSLPSSKLWNAQPVHGANEENGMDIGRGLASVKGGVEIGSGRRSAIVTNTTVEIVVPDNVINSIYGENGSNLSRLRQISGAKVTVHEPQPGSTDTIVVISGSPDQTQAAQSLLQAFILQDHHDD